MNRVTDNEIALATAITSLQNAFEALESMKHGDSDELDDIKLAVRQAKLRCKGALTWLNDIKFEED